MSGRGERRGKVVKIKNGVCKYTPLNGESIVSIIGLMFESVGMDHCCY